MFSKILNIWTSIITAVINVQHGNEYDSFKGTLPFLEIGSFYNSPRVKQLSFTGFESIQSISESGRSTFSLA